MPDFNAYCVERPVLHHSECEAFAAAILAVKRVVVLGVVRLQADVGGVLGECTPALVANNLQRHGIMPCCGVIPGTMILGGA